MFITVEKFQDENGKLDTCVNHFDSEAEALVFYESQMSFFLKKPNIILAEVIDVEMKAVRKSQF